MVESSQVNGSQESILLAEEAAARAAEPGLRRLADTAEALLSLQSLLKGLGTDTVTTVALTNVLREQLQAAGPKELKRIKKGLGKAAAALTSPGDFSAKEDTATSVVTLVPELPPAPDSVRTAGTDTSRDPTQTVIDVVPDKPEPAVVQAKAPKNQPMPSATEAEPVNAPSQPEAEPPQGTTSVPTESTADPEPLIEQNKGVAELTKIFDGIFTVEQVSVLQSLSETQLTKFRDCLTVVYEQNSKHPGMANTQIKRIMLYIQGKSKAEAADILEEKVNTLTASLKSVNGVFVRGTQALQDGFNAISPKPVSEDELKKTKDRKYRPEEWQERILDMIEPYWPAEAVRSMKDLLANRHPSETKLAQVELEGLLYGYARFMPQKKVGMPGLTQTQWKTLSRLSGYRLEQGQQKLPIRGVQAMFAAPFKDIDRVNFNTGFVTSLEYLMKQAVDDGLYVAEDTDEAAEPVQVGPADSLPVPQTQHNRLRSKLIILEQPHRMILHLGQHHQFLRHNGLRQLTPSQTNLSQRCHLDRQK